MEIGFNTNIGYYIDRGEFKVSWDTQKRLEAGEISISRPISERLYGACEGNSAALTRLKQLGIYKTETGSTVFEGSTDAEEILGIDESEMAEAHLKFSKRRDNQKTRPATRLRRRDLRSNKNQTRHRKPYKWKNGGIESVVKKTKGESNGKESTIEKKSQKGPSGGYVTSVNSLYNACASIYHGDVRSGQMYDVYNSLIREPVRMMLRFMQSRRDRGIDISVEDVMSRKDPVINERISRWEERSNLYFDSVYDLMRGDLYKKKEVKGDSNAKEEPTLVQVRSNNNGTIHVSSGYQSSPERYVTNERELLSAVRRVFRGETTVDDFHILDPRSRLILEYAQDSRAVTNGDVKPRDIVSLKAPELRNRISKAGLENYRPQFVYK